MKQSWILSGLILLFLISSIIVVVNGEINEKTGTVTNIVDGDTFDISTGDRIRPADIDAPEMGNAGGQEAKDYLSSWIYGKTVYLDEDDLSGPDQWGRLICVVYLSYNSTHYLNVNKLMVNAGHAVIDNYDNNEFNPYSWSLYVSKAITPTPSPTPSPTISPSPTVIPTPSPTNNPSPSPTITPTATPTPTLTPTPSIDPTPVRFSYTKTIILGSIIILVIVGVLAYYKKYRK